MTLGQEFEGYAACVRAAREDVDVGARTLLELNLGATALGTGLNAGPEYVERAFAAPERGDGHRVCGPRQLLPRDAEHGRRGRALRRGAAAGD